MWSLPRRGIKPMSPALVGRFLSNAPKCFDSISRSAQREVPIFFSFLSFFFKLYGAPLLMIFHNWFNQSPVDGHLQLEMLCIKDVLYSVIIIIKGRSIQWRTVRIAKWNCWMKGYILLKFWNLITRLSSHFGCVWRCWLPLTRKVQHPMSSSWPVSWT